MSSTRLDLQFQQQAVVKEVYRNVLLSVTQIEKGYRGSLHKDSLHFADAIGSNLDNLVQQLRNQVDQSLLKKERIASEQLLTQPHLQQAMQTIYPHLTVSQQGLLLAHLDSNHSSIGRERCFKYLLNRSSLHSCSDILIAYALISNRVADELGLQRDLSNEKLTDHLNLILKRRIDNKGQEHFKLHHGIVDAIANSAVSR
jgi:hypothetical protein